MLISQAAELPDRGKLRTRPEGVAHESWKTIYEDLQNRLSERNSYWKVFDPWQDVEPIRGSISDDLADTWRDLKAGLLVLDAGSLANAVAEWRFSFHYHWGPNHATHVLRPLLTIAFEDED